MATDIFPESREEEILVSTINGEEYNKAPESRIEALLLELKEVIEEGGGGGGTTNYNLLSNKPSINSVTLTGDKSSSDLGIPTAADLAGKQDVLPVAASGNDVAFNGDIQDGQGNTLSVLAEALTKTASGNPVVISDCAGGKARSLVTTIEAIQDLHGYDKPWTGGANVQLVDFSAYSTLVDNVSLSYIDGDLTLRSTGTTPNYPLVQYDIKSLKGKTLYFACDFSSSAEGLGHIQIVYSVGGQISYIEVGRNPDPQTGRSIPNIVDWVSLRIYLRNGTSVGADQWAKFGKIMCASSANPTYSPYSNICPISGRTAVVVDDVGVNLTEDRISGCNLMSNGGIITDATFDMQIAKVKQGETYVITTDDTSGAVYGFFTSKPVQGSTSYNGTRYVTAVKTFTAPITGYVAYRTFANYATPQCEIGSTPTPYQPYQHSSATIQLGQTVYGGTLNVTTGELTITHKLVDASAWSWGKTSSGFFTPVPTDMKIEGTSGLSYPDCICSHFPISHTSQTYAYANMYYEFDRQFYRTWINNYQMNLTAEQFNTHIANMGIKFCYKLATPTTIQLTPTQLQLLKGYNRVTIESGTITLDYLAKTDSIQAEVDALDANKAEKTTIAPVENGTKASQAYTIGKHFIRDNKFCTAIATIASGATLTKNTNYVEGTIADNLIKQDTFSGTTTANGNVLLHNSLNRKILCAISDTANQIVTIYPTSSEIWGHVTQNSAEVPVVANTAVSGIYYYI